MTENSQNDKILIDKEKISEILDISREIETQNANKQMVYILNGSFYELPSDMTKDQCLELVKLKTINRKRKLSTGSEDSCDSQVEKPLFGRKDIIYIDREEGDSLQKLAITFNCSVAEIKLANKIYMEQELHALKTVKIPVLKDGTLYHQYNNKVQEDTQNQSSQENDEFSKYNVDSKYKFRVEKPFEIDPHLNYVSDEDGEYDIYDIKDSETHHLLVDTPLRVKKNQAGNNPVNVCESTLHDFINNMDEKIKKDVQKVETVKESYEEVVNSLTEQVIFPPGRVGEHDKYGSVCSLTWKHFALALCIVAVVIPTIYVIHFYYKRVET